MHPDIEAVTDRIRRQTEEILALVDTLDHEAFSTRPAADRWSVGEHLAHVAILVRGYVEEISEAVTRARQKGWTRKDGPFKRGWVGRKFVALMEPPPRKRVKTGRALVPGPEVERSMVVGDFRDAQNALVDVLEGADGVDLGRAKVASPFLPLLRLRAIQAAEAVAAHTDRHLWLMRETLEHLREL